MPVLTTSAMSLQYCSVAEAALHNIDVNSGEEKILLPRKVQKPHSIPCMRIEVSLLFHDYFQ